MDGTARYYRDRIVDIADLPDKDYPDEFQGDAGTATLDLVLSAPSCAHVTYTLTVHALNGDVLGKTSVPGDGSGTPAQPLVLTTRVTDYPQDCLKALIATTSVQGIVVDTAPDAIPADSPVCDGGSPSLSYR